MPNYTDNYNLVKPLPSELYDVNTFNENADKLDAELKRVKTESFYSGTIDNVNLNDLTTSGIYGYALSCTNKPTSKSGAVIVHNYKTTWVLQFAIVHLNSTVYARYSSDAGSTWGSWNVFYTANNLSPVSNHGEIPSATDLNDLQDIGYHYVSKKSVAETLVNCPTSTSFFMEVGKHAGYYQRIVEFDTSKPKIYFRNYYYEHGWGEWFREYTTFDKPTTAELGTHSLSERGIDIPQSSNLDNYTAPGDYYVKGATDAATITNTPITGSGYRLIVEAGYVSGYVRQYAIGVGGNIQTRYYQTSWSPWMKIMTNADVAAEIAKIADYDSEVF